MKYIFICENDLFRSLIWPILWIMQYATFIARLRIPLLHLTYSTDQRSLLFCPFLKLHKILSIIQACRENKYLAALIWTMNQTDRWWPAYTDLSEALTTIRNFFMISVASAWVHKILNFFGLLNLIVIKSENTLHFWTWLLLTISSLFVSSFCKRNKKKIVEYLKTLLWTRFCWQKFNFSKYPFMKVCSKTLQKILS